MLEKLQRSEIFRQWIKPIVRPFYRLIKRLRQKNQTAQRDRQLEPIIVRERALLEQARRDHPDERYRAGDPLVSVTIPTYNRARLLTERSLPAALQQTYTRIEVVIVGDHTSDNTADLLANYLDSRVRFYNLPSRYAYPKDVKNLQRVGGVLAANRAMELAQGEWIAHLDDDSIFTPDHVEVLLRHAQQYNLEFIYGLSLLEITPGQWEERGKYNPNVKGKNAPFVAHSSILYRSYLRLFPYDIDSWKYSQGADANRWMRMHRAGVRIGFLDQVVVHLPINPTSIPTESPQSNENKG